MPTNRVIIACPRCDRRYVGKIGEPYKPVLDRVIAHVKGQHPDHDPLWYETHGKDHEGE